ncbi:MAG: DUF2341 domain-containing protein, partial [Planctomycetes bacterium]|nr:DUF2341 domain-containing protein [Planctomycetota bacterium]
VESDDPYETLQSIFQRGVTESEGFEVRAQAILEQIRTGGLGIEVELLSDFEMRNAVGAYAAIGHTGAERIYLNGSLIAAGLDIERLTNALLEEFGHALDARLNPGGDGRGDEGELFAAVVMGRNVSQEEREAIIAEDDHGFIAIDGVAVAVERSGPTLNGWQYRQQLVFSNASRAENLDDFPILVSINTTTFGSSFYSQAKANGADLRFLDGNGASLAYEIQTWNTSGTSLVWVKVPRIDASSNSDSIFAFWGNASASDSQNAASVWSNGYVGVWHMEQTNGAANSILDSTSYANHGTPVGIDSSNVVSTGAVGNAINFSNIWGPQGLELDYITIPSTNGDELTPQSLTLEAWAWRNYTNDGSNWRNIVARTSSGAGDSFTLSADGWSPNGPNDLSFWGTGGVTASNALAFQQWRYLAASRDTTGGNIYSNGVSLATLGGGNLNYNDPNVLIGAQWNGGSNPDQEWTGYIDEVRISNVKRSANWISAQYASMTGSLITYAGVTTVNQYSVGPVSDTNAAGNSVSENAASGTNVGITAYAVDQDTTNNTITYTLDDNAGGRFAINASTGVVTVSNGSLLNFESATSHTITVRATSADSSFSTANFTISLTDVDEFDVGAISDTNAAANSLEENSANGTAVGITASASDADGSNNTITYSLDNNAGGRFAINSSTGVVTVANSSLLNFESATSHTITVRASSSDGSASTANLTITLSDIDEFDVGAISDTNGAANSIAENSANGTAVGITASASDADGSNNTITYSLDDSAGGRFAINSSTGVVTVANSTLLNFEAGTSHTITVRATSSDGSASTANYTVSVTDVDEFDVGAISDTNAAANSVAENSANGTAVGITASASDADGSNNTITYSLDNTAGGRFTINSSTGVVTVANSSLLDFESATSHTITVRASSSDGSFSTANFTISLTNVNETPSAVADTATAVEAGGVSNGTVGTNPTGNVLTNDTDVDAGDTKTVTGVAAGTVGSASTNVGSNVTGTYGTINIGSTGAFTYTVDNSNATVQALRTTANTLTDVFTYTMRDTAGLTSTTQITVTIQG